MSEGLIAEINGAGVWIEKPGQAKRVVMPDKYHVGTHKGDPAVVSFWDYFDSSGNSKVPGANLKIARNYVPKGKTTQPHFHPENSDVEEGTPLISVPFYVELFSELVKASPETILGPRTRIYSPRAEGFYIGLDFSEDELKEFMENLKDPLNSRTETPIPRKMNVRRITRGTREIFQTDPVHWDVALNPYYRFVSFCPVKDKGWYLPEAFNEYAKKITTDVIGVVLK